MASHTPGPWKRGSCDSYIVWAKGYRSTSYTEGPEGPEAVAIASIDAPWWVRVPCSLSAREAWEAETNATADLIAAAPDLLEALHAVVRVADRQTVEFDLARAAIAKAEGRS